MKKELCSRCKTGRDSLLLDPRSDTCPYLGTHSGKKCGMYVKLKKPKKDKFFRRILRKIFIKQNKQVDNIL